MGLQSKVVCNSFCCNPTAAVVVAVAAAILQLVLKEKSKPRYFPTQCCSKKKKKKKKAPRTTGYPERWTQKTQKTKSSKSSKHFSLKNSFLFFFTGQYSILVRFPAKQRREARNIFNNRLPFRTSKDETFRPNYLLLFLT